MPRPSTHCPSMPVITRTLMRRNKRVSGRDLAASSKIAWPWLNLTLLVSLSMGLLFRKMPTWLTRQRRRERHRQWALRAAPHSGFALSSRARREPPFSTSHSSSGGIGHPSIHSLRGRSGLLFLSRASRRSGCSSRGYAPICFRVTTVGSRGTLHETARCHQN